MADQTLYISHFGDPIRTEPAPDQEAKCLPCSWIGIGYANSNHTSLAHSV
jgi:hypothetical protein